MYWARPCWHPIFSGCSVHRIPPGKSWKNFVVLLVTFFSFLRHFLPGYYCETIDKLSHLFMSTWPLFRSGIFIRSDRIAWVACDRVALPQVSVFITGEHMMPETKTTPSKERHGQGYLHNSAWANKNVTAEKGSGWHEWVVLRASTKILQKARKCNSRENSTNQLSYIFALCTIRGNVAGGFCTPACRQSVTAFK